MREIKFRAWDKEQKEMVYPRGEIFEWAWFGDCYADKGDGDGNPAVEVMQFTGLKDKNGKEIYEGDVVRRPEDESPEEQKKKYPGVGLYIQRREEIEEVAYNDGGFSPFSIAGWEGTLDGSECEVIGNIYENPELLNDASQESPPQSSP